MPISAIQGRDPVIYIYTHTYIYPHIYMCIHIYIHTFPFLSYLPSCSIPRDWIEFPVLYSRTSLLIYSKWNHLHLLTSNSQSILIFFLVFFLEGGAAFTAYRGSQARGRIGAYGLTPQPQQCVCDLHHSSWQRRILNPLSEARD